LHGGQPNPEQSLRRQQCDVAAGSAIDLQQVAAFEILNRRSLSGQHSPAVWMSCNVPRTRAEPVSSATNTLRDWGASRKQWSWELFVPKDRKTL
jgi:hypothetical protein